VPGNRGWGTHGTAVAGKVAGVDSGVFKQANLISVSLPRLLDQNGQLYNPAVIAFGALHDAFLKVLQDVQQKKDFTTATSFVVNISLRLNWSNTRLRTLAQDRINALLAQDIVVVFSSGNCRVASENCPVRFLFTPSDNDRSLTIFS